MINNFWHDFEINLEWSRLVFFINVIYIYFENFLYSIHVLHFFLDLSLYSTKNVPYKNKFIDDNKVSIRFEVRRNTVHSLNIYFNKMKLVIVPFACLLVVSAEVRNGMHTSSCVSMNTLFAHKCRELVSNYLFTNIKPFKILLFITLWMLVHE